MSPTSADPVRLDIDHVLIATRDLATAASQMEARYGLASIAGGLHPGWGTENRIVPLGETYLELVSVVDETEATQSAFGRWVASGARFLLLPIGWAVRTEQIDSVARRLGLSIRAGSRRTPAGDLLQWRSAGVEEVAAESSLPFFIDWHAGTPHPGRAPAKHPGGGAKIARILARGESSRMEAWLGTRVLPVEVTPGEPQTAGVVLSRAGREIIIGPVQAP